MEVLLRFSGYTPEEVYAMPDRQVWQLWFAASSFWSETLSAVFGGVNQTLGGDGQVSSMPSPPSGPSSPFGGRQGSTSYSSHQFPN
jgi:hypothetical protein